MLYFSEIITTKCFTGAKKQNKKVRIAGNKRSIQIEL